MPRWTWSILRLGGAAAAGAVVALGAGQVAQLFTNSCSLLCNPSVAMPVGALAGAFAFFPVGRD